MTKKRTPSSEPKLLRAFLLGAAARPDVLAEAQRLRPIIERYAAIVSTDFTGAEDLSNVEADLAIVLGGDGSILRAARQMGHRQVPVAAINLGKLGFLANMTPAELPDVLRDFAAGKLRIIEHLMFECTVLRGCEKTGTGSEPRCEDRAKQASCEVPVPFFSQPPRGGEVCVRQLGLNEVVVQAGTPFTLIDVDLYVDSELVTTYSCDGLIVGTPVGSTAHCLSAGGPILQKSLQAFVVLPLSPHTLTMRPVVDSADCVYEMVVERPNAGTSVVIDGRVLCRLQPGDRVRVERAAAQFKLVANPGHTYYRTLREKLGWGGRLKLNDL